MMSWDVLLSCLPIGLFGFHRATEVTAGRTYVENPRPRICAPELDLEKLTRETWAAIEHVNDPPALFRHGGNMARIEEDDNGIPVVQTVTTNRLRHFLVGVVTWYKLTNEGEKVCRPDGELIQNLLATPNPELPVLTSIVEAPFFAQDGSLVSQPGHHHRTGTFYAPLGYPSHRAAKSYRKPTI